MQLVADVGGTNARLALAEGGRLRRETQRRYAGDDFAAFEQVLDRFLLEAGGPRIEAACIAVAGPVSGGRAALTNRDWRFDASTLAARTGAAEVRLINDLTALGYAIAVLPRHVLRAAPAGAAANGQSLVVNAGTGFNVCASLALPGGGVALLESEEGHTDLPASILRRLGPLADRFDSVEELLAGRGLAALHAARGGVAATSGAAVVAASEAGDPAAATTCDLHAALLGLMLRELALRYMPRGGLWLAGSVARAMVPRLAAITAAMTRPAPLDGIAAAVPLLLVEDDMAGLLGCATALKK